MTTNPSVQPSVKNGFTKIHTSLSSHPHSSSASVVTMMTVDKENNKQHQQQQQNNSDYRMITNNAWPLVSKQHPWYKITTLSRKINSSNQDFESLPLVATIDWDALYKNPEERQTVKMTGKPFVQMVLETREKYYEYKEKDTRTPRPPPPPPPLESTPSTSEMIDDNDCDKKMNDVLKEKFHIPQLTPSFLSSAISGEIGQQANLISTTLGIYPTPTLPSPLLLLVFGGQFPILISTFDNIRMLLVLRIITESIGFENEKEHDAAEISYMTARKLYMEWFAERSEELAKIHQKIFWEIPGVRLCNLKKEFSVLSKKNQSQEEILRKRVPILLALIEYRAFMVEAARRVANMLEVYCYGVLLGTNMVERFSSRLLASTLLLSTSDNNTEQDFSSKTRVKMGYPNLGVRYDKWSSDRRIEMERAYLGMGTEASDLSLLLTQNFYSVLSNSKQLGEYLGNNPKVLSDVLACQKHKTVEFFNLIKSVRENQKTQFDKNKKTSTANDQVVSNMDDFVDRAGDGWMSDRSMLEKNRFELRLMTSATVVENHDNKFKLLDPADVILPYSLLVYIQCTEFYQKVHLPDLSRNAANLSESSQ
jgi:hypothetical protein